MKEEIACWWQTFLFYST